jgi:restriction endonuclease S subunit
MSKTSPLELTEMVTNAAILLLFAEMRRRLPSLTLSNLVYIHNGQGLRAEEREAHGNEDVFGSGGCVGKHTKHMHPGPFVVIGRKGSAGKATFAERGGWVTDTAYFATPIRAEELDCKFLFFAIKSLDFSRDIISTAIPGINRTALYQYSVPLPPLAVQLAVVDFLDALSDRPHEAATPLLPAPLAEQGRVVARIEELAAKIEEAGELRKQAAEEAEALIVSTHLQLAGMRNRKLGELLTLDEDEVRVTPDGHYPQVGVRGFGGGLFPKREISGMETTYKVFNQLYEGALVLSQVKGWEGAIGVCDSNLAGWFVSPEYRTFRCIPGKARPAYLAALVRTEWFWGRLKDATRGVGARRERTRPEQFLTLQVPMPEVEQQEMGERIFVEIEALNTIEKETAAELEALMPSILDKAFRGEL